MSRRLSFYLSRFFSLKPVRFTTQLLFCITLSYLLGIFNNLGDEVRAKPLLYLP